MCGRFTRNYIWAQIHAMYSLGAAPKRSVIIVFDSKEKAQGWYNSAAQKEINAIRTKTTKSRAFVVEGM